MHKRGWKFIFTCTISYCIFYVNYCTLNNSFLSAWILIFVTWAMKTPILQNLDLSARYSDPVSGRKSVSFHPNSWCDNRLIAFASEPLPNQNNTVYLIYSFNALPLLVRWQKGHPACKKSHQQSQRFFVWPMGDPG